jgi:polysaccharide export outer membrane protein
MRRAVALSLMGLVLAGCSQLDLSASGTRLDVASLGPTSAESRSLMRAQRLAEVLARWRRERRVAPERYTLGPGDLLEVSVFGIEAPNRMSTFVRAVGGDGSLPLPWSDPFQAEGITVEELEETVKAAYRGRYLKEPQVTARVLEYNAKSVVVTGAVRAPGVFYLTENRSSLLEMLAEAGGLENDAGDELLLVRGEAAAPEVIPVDLRELIDRGNLAANLEVRDGDILTVPPAVEGYVYVLGYVRRPGVYRMQRGQRLDALRAVALGGGLLTTGRASNCVLLRQRPQGQDVYNVDLTRASRGKEPPLYMEPGDVLVVGSSSMAKISEVFRPSMGASVSASASVVP